METKAGKRLEQQMAYLTTHRHTLTADGDTHLTDIERLKGSILQRYRASDNLYQGRPIAADDLLREMDMAGIDISICWQNPSATPYDGHPFEALLDANRYIYEQGCLYPHRIIPAGWTDPGALGLNDAIEIARICICDWGMPFVKFNPAQNSFQLDSDNVMQLIDAITTLGAVPAFHMAADTPFTPVSGLQHLAETFPHTPLLAVHMGGGGASYLEAEKMYGEIRELGLQYPNLYFVESAKRDIHIESDIITYALEGEEAWKRIFCGSDAPYGRMTWNYGGYRKVFESLINNTKHTDARVRAHVGLFTKQLAARFMGGNLTDFVKEIYDSMIINPIFADETFQANIKASVTT